MIGRTVPARVFEGAQTATKCQSGLFLELDQYLNFKLNVFIQPERFMTPSKVRAVSICSANKCETNSSQCY